MGRSSFVDSAQCNKILFYVKSLHGSIHSKMLKDVTDSIDEIHKETESKVLLALCQDLKILSQE